LATAIFIGPPAARDSARTKKQRYSRNVRYRF
jgi:hypothetical protein